MSGRRILLTALSVWLIISAGAVVPKASAAVPTPILTAGQVLPNGAQRLSPNRFVKLVLAHDGNLILYAGGRAIWVSGTAGHAGARATLQRDGNFVLVDRAGRAFWSSRTAGTGTANRLVIDNSGAVRVVNAANRTLWTSGSAANTLRAGATLASGQRLHAVSGEELVLQSGNLVLYRAGRAVWTSRTPGHPGAFARVRSDGNFVVYSAGARGVLWTTGIPRTGTSNHLDLRRGGALVLVTGSGQVVWQARTAAPGTRAQLAGRLLAMWGGRFGGTSGVRADLLAASRGRAIRNSDSCGNAVQIDVRLLALLLKMTSRYSIYLNNIITGHGCDSAQHPRGSAADIGNVTVPGTRRTTNFDSYRAGDNVSLDREFVRFLAGSLPAGAGLGQWNCPGRNISRPPGVATFADACNHQHVQMGRAG